MAEKLEMHTKDLTVENIDKIAELFPNCVTESLKDGNPVRSIDFDALRQELSDNIVDGPMERYQFTWPDKSKAKLLANSPIDMTLRPCPEESVDFDNTKNLYIEGDNLEVLKLLRETYLGKVKMIYIDPPYNTGKDFLYDDDYSISTKDYSDLSGDKDNEGRMLVSNPTTNGRFHTDWLNMIYSRLKVAKDLMADDGVIFISIDDNEIFNLGKICDEIFGEQNFIAQMVIDGTPKNDPLIISTSHEYCLAYVKNYDCAKSREWGVVNPLYAEPIRIFNHDKGNYDHIMAKLKQYYKDSDLLDDNISNYKFADELGVYRIGPIDDPQGAGSKDKRMNPITGHPCATPSRGWSCTLETWEQWKKEGLIAFPEDDSKLPSKKTYISANQLDVIRAYFKLQTRKDTDALKKMFDGKKVFLFPKPVSFIKTLIDGCTGEGDIILDFFSGSGTTAHATMSQCATDNKKRNYIMVQLPENLEDNLKHASGNRSKKSLEDAIEFCKDNHYPPFLTEIAKERIRRVGNNIHQSLAQSTLDGKKNIDCGFRVLKLSSSNMKDVYYSPDKITQAGIDGFVDNIKEDRTHKDLLFQCMLDLGIELSVSISSIKVEGKEVYDVDNGYLLACFDDNVSESVVTEIAKKKPVFAVMRDSSMDSDSTATNFEQIFRSYSPTTVRKVI